MPIRIISALAEGENETEEEYKVIFAERTDGEYKDYAVGFDFVINKETKPVILIFQDLDSAKDVYDQICDCISDEPDNEV